LAQRYSLEIKINNCQEKKVIISDFQKKTILGTEICKNGIVTFSGKLDEPIFSKLEVEGNDSYLDFFLDNKEFKINTFKDSLWKAQILNSELNDEYKNYENLIANPIREELVNYTIEKRNLDSRDSSKIDKIKNKIDSLQAESQRNLIEFIKKKPNSYLSLFFLKGLAIELPKIKELFDSLIPSLKNTPSGKAFFEKINKIGTIKAGDKAPNFLLSDNNSQKISLSNFIDKYIYLDFWASWCGPCRAKHPELVKQYQSTKNDKFEFISISNDEDLESWNKAIQKDKLTWYQLIDEIDSNGLSTSNYYGVYGIPSNFLIDKNGFIIKKDISIEDLKIFLSNLK
jgi:thiol-disulfide isomerase/thioredoxin